MKLSATIRSENSFLSIRPGWILAFLLAGNTALGQKKIARQQLIWYGYYHTLELNRKWSLYGEIQERHFVRPVAQHQLVLRGYVFRTLSGQVKVSGGLVYFLQSPQDPNSNNSLLIPELRPDLGLYFQQSHGNFLLTHRYKIEARFIHNSAEGRLTDGYGFSNFRFRYQVGLEYPVWKSKSPGKRQISLRLRDELMINVGNKIVSNVFDQNRIYLGLHYKLSPSFAIEAGYMNWFQERQNGKDFYNRDIIRFSFFHQTSLLH